MLLNLWHTAGISFFYILTCPTLTFSGTKNWAFITYHDYYKSHLPSNRDTPRSYKLILSGPILTVHVLNATTRDGIIVNVGHHRTVTCLIRRYLHQNASVSVTCAWSLTRYSRRTPMLLPLHSREAAARRPTTYAWVALSRAKKNMGKMINAQINKSSNINRIGREIGFFWLLLCVWNVRVQRSFIFLVPGRCIY